MLGRTWLPDAAEARGIYDVEVRVRRKDLTQAGQRRYVGSGPLRSGGDSMHVPRPDLTLIKSPQRN